MRERKLLHNQLMEMKGNIRVFCRVRPLIEIGPPKTLSRFGRWARPPLSLPSAAFPRRRSCCFLCRSFADERCRHRPSP